MNDIQEKIFQNIYIKIVELLSSSTLDITRDINNGSIPLQVGSIIARDVTYGNFADHTGIYIGNNEVIDFNYETGIKKISIKEFAMPGNKYYPIFTATWNNSLIYSEEWSNFATNQLNKNINYELILSNCHNFIYSCIKNNETLLKHKKKRIIDYVELSSLFQYTYEILTHKGITTFDTLSKELFKIKIMNSGSHIISTSILISEQIKLYDVEHQDLEKILEILTKQAANISIALFKWKIAKF